MLPTPRPVVAAQGQAVLPLEGEMLQVFRKTTSRMTKWGQFLAFIKKAEVEGLKLLDKRGYLTIRVIFQEVNRVNSDFVPYVIFIPQETCFTSKYVPGIYILPCPK